MKKITGFTLLSLLFTLSIQAQNKVLGILGSSTAAGVGASVYDSSWAGRLDHYYRVTNAVISSTVNLAISGGTPYIAMPDGYVPPAGRPNPNTDHNITELMTYNPDVVIISFVSNGYNTYTFEEIKFTLQTIHDIAVSAGKIAYVTTSQPRTSFGTTARQRLRDIKDSIIKWFGVNSINFFDSIVNPQTLAIRDEYNSGDDIHLNNAGHAVLFRQVVSKDIFNTALAVKLLDFSVQQLPGKKIGIKWTTTDEMENTRFTIERSMDGKEFKTIRTIEGRNRIGNQQYMIEDQVFSVGRYYYRINFGSGTNSKYSSIQSILISELNETILVKGNPSGNTIRLEIYAGSTQLANIIFISMNGIVLKSQSLQLNNGSNTISVNISSLPPGKYTLQLKLEGKTMTTGFIKAY